MALDLGLAIRQGAARLAGRRGLTLVAAFGLVRVLGLTATDTVTRANQAFLEEAQLPDSQAELLAALTAVETPLALPVSLSTAFGLWLVAAVLAESAHIVAIRTFVGERAAGDPESVLRRLTRATLAGFVAGIVVIVLTGIGLVLLVLPGVFAAVGFYFVRQEIAVEDASVVDALTDSWERTRGHRLKVFVLAVLVTSLNFAAGFSTALAGVLTPAGAALVGAAISALTTVFGIAVATRAYEQLRREPPPDSPPEPDEAAIGPLDADDLEDFDWGE